jgi:uncharacterized protein (DUF427 family)
LFSSRRRSCHSSAELLFPLPVPTALAGGTHLSLTELITHHHDGVGRRVQDDVMSGYPEPMVPPGGIAPVPRRLRGKLGDTWLFDTERAWYVWEFPPYPQYYIPLDDVDSSLLVDEETTEETAFGTAAHRGLRAGGITRPGAARIQLDDAPEQLRQTVRFDWAALDAWFEEDEQVFVHPRNPYSRVDAVRSNRPIRVELSGVIQAEAPCSVMVFETGLPPRYYLDRTAIRLDQHEESDSVSSCPYKGQTSQYWSVRVGAEVHHDLAWSYDFPTRQLLPIAGLVAYYNEKVDIWLDGRKLERPRTHFS